MQVTDTFSKVINDHLQALAAKDALFAETLKKPKKNIKDCCNYILNTVQASGKQGFADEEIYGMAVHYYDEDDIKVGKPVNAQVVVNHTIAKQEPAKVQAVPAPKKLTKVIANQPSLF